MASESATDTAGTPAGTRPDPLTGTLNGPVTLSTLDGTRAVLDGMDGAQALDLSRVTELDTAGAWLIASHQSRAQVEGRSLTLTGASAAHTLLLQKVTDALPPARRPARRRVHHHAGDDLARFGAGITAYGASFGASIGFFGQVIAAMGRVVVQPARLRGTALVHHMHQSGLNAVPIVALMGFLIGIVLAFQGATQLQQFGAEVFVVDLIAISILRELGILLTAIIVAGRSASAFTAAIGSMKMREEIDAMRVLGLDPVELLVLPRILALIILLPVLGFIANMAGLFGGGLMAWIDLGISPGMFRTQLLANTDVSHALVGLSKAPLFALIIGVVGCYQGLQVKGDTESLGNQTSKSVVIAIFMVIVVDALFSIFFAIWGV